MNLYGFSDSLADVGKTVHACEGCGATARIANGLCLGCLLQPALAGEGSNGETFAAALGEIDLHDTEWRLGNYQVLEESAAVAWASIYRARQRYSRRIVALKLHPRPITPIHVKRWPALRREAEAAASLDHPNILPIYEVGETEMDSLLQHEIRSGGTFAEIGLALRDKPREMRRVMLAKVSRAVRIRSQSRHPASRP